MEIISKLLNVWSQSPLLIIGLIVLIIFVISQSVKPKLHSDILDDNTMSNRKYYYYVEGIASAVNEWMEKHNREVWISRELSKVKLLYNPMVDLYSHYERPTILGFNKVNGEIMLYIEYHLYNQDMFFQDKIPLTHIHIDTLYNILVVLDDIKTREGNSKAVNRDDLIDNITKAILAKVSQMNNLNYVWPIWGKGQLMDGYMDGRHALITGFRYNVDFEVVEVGHFWSNDTMTMYYGSLENLDTESLIRVSKRIKAISTYG